MRFSVFRALPLLLGMALTPTATAWAGEAPSATAATTVFVRPIVNTSKLVVTSAGRWKLSQRPLLRMSDSTQTDAGTTSAKDARLAQRATRYKRSGPALLGAGIGLTVTGIVLAGVGLGLGLPLLGSGSFGPALGVVFIASGTVLSLPFLIAGIPMWSVGAHQVSKSKTAGVPQMKRRAVRVAVHPVVRHGGGGAGLSARF